MFICPHCKRAGITQLGKWAARDVSPAKCSLCGEFSFAGSATAGGIVVGTLLLFTAAGFAGIATHSYSVGIIGVFLAIAFYVWRSQKAPLLPIGSAHVIPGAKAGFLAGMVGTFLSLLP